MRIKAERMVEDVDIILRFGGLYDDIVRHIYLLTYCCPMHPLY